MPWRRMGEQARDDLAAKRGQVDDQQFVRVEERVAGARQRVGIGEALARVAHPGAAGVERPAASLVGRGRVTEAEEHEGAVEVGSASEAARRCPLVGGDRPEPEGAEGLVGAGAPLSFAAGTVGHGLGLERVAEQVVDERSAVSVPRAQRLEGAQRVVEHRGRVRALAAAHDGQREAGGLPPVVAAGLETLDLGGAAVARQAALGVGERPSEEGKAAAVHERQGRERQGTDDEEQG